jgi:hypothetical protein
MYAFSRFLVPVRFILMQMFHAMAVRWPLRGPPGYGFRDTIVTIAQCEQHADKLRGIWQEFINTLDPSNLVATVVYKNSKGQSFTNSVADILLQVLMHSTYHRGQIATEMRALGHTPAYTDFIVAARFNLLS